MTAEEIIAEVRSIAKALAIRGVHPGEVSISVRYRVKQLLYQCPFAPWYKKGRRYLTKQGSAIFNGQPATIPVIKTLGGIEAVIDDIAVEICKGIIDHLNVANWKQMVSNEMTPQYHNWTPEIAEAAISQAAQGLPELCDKLEAYKTAVVKVESRKGELRQHIDYRQPTKTRDDEPPKPPAAPKVEGTPVERQAETLAGGEGAGGGRGEADGKPTKPRRGRRKGVTVSDVKEDQRIADAWAKGSGQYASQEELATAFDITKPDVVAALDRHRKRPAKLETIRAGKRRQAQ